MGRVSGRCLRVLTPPLAKDRTGALTPHAPLTPHGATRDEAQPFDRRFMSAIVEAVSSLPTKKSCQSLN